MTDPIKLQLTPNGDGTFAMPPVVLVPPPQPAVQPPTAPTIDFEFAQLKGLVGQVKNNSVLPDGGSCQIAWGPPKAGSAVGPRGTTSFGYSAAGNYPVSVSFKAADGTIYSTTKQVVIVDPTAPPSNTPTPPTSPPPPPSTNPVEPPIANVYAAMLAGLTLPAKSPWSDTSPAYTAAATVKLLDGTVLTCDTSKQVPDYVPYAGIWIYPLLLPDGSRHPDLTLDCHPDGWKISNMWVDGSANYSGHHTVAINGAVVEDTDDTYAFGTATVPCRKGLPQATPTRNWGAKTIPNYAKIAGGYKPWTAQLAAADNSPTGRSMTTPYNGMGTQGAQYSIAIFHAAMIPFLVDGGIENWNVVQTIEDHAWRWPVALRSRLTGLPAFPFTPECRDVSILPNCPNMPGHFNPVKTIENSPLQADPAHTPGFGIVSYLATGSSIALESMLMWAAYATYWGNPASFQYEKCICYQQERGIAWDLRSKVYAAALCPKDYPLYEGLQTVVANNASHFDALYGASGTMRNRFGIFANGAFAYDVGTNANAGFPPWQQDFLASVVHQTIDLGFAGWDGIAAYLDGFTSGRMGDGVTGLMYTTLGYYTMAPLTIASYPTGVAPTPDKFVATWQDFNNQNLTAHGHADQIGKTVDQADVGAGPGNVQALTGTPTSYPANFQPACAALGPNHPAWLKFEAEILPHQDYSTGGQFNILPRAA